VSGPLTCRQTTYLVCGDRDEPMTDAQRRQLQAHLTTCGACQVAARQFAQLFGQLDTLFAKDAK
jgi:Leu/Phe-tRNA-protein transferase